MLTPPNPNAGKRRLAYLDPMEELGLEPHIISIAGEGWELEEIGYKGGLNVLQKKELSTSTVFAAMIGLQSILAAAFEMGLRAGLITIWICALQVTIIIHFLGSLALFDNTT